MNLDLIQKNIISYVAVSPMVYYRFKGGNFDAESKSELRKYIVISQVRQVFGAATNSALTSIREALKAAPRIRLRWVIY